MNSCPLPSSLYQTFRGRTNAIVEIGKRMCQSDDEWKQKCAAMKELRTMLSEYALLQDAKKSNAHADDGGENTSNSNSSVDESLFTPENIQTLTQPFRTTVLYTECHGENFNCNARVCICMTLICAFSAARPALDSREGGVRRVRDARSVRGRSKEQNHRP